MTTTEKLWELTADIEQLEDLIADIQEDEDLSDLEKDKRLSYALQEWLQLDGDFERKAENVARYIKYLQLMTAARREEYRRLRALADSSEAMEKRLKAYLVANLEATGKKKIKGEFCQISLRKKPAKVVLDIPPENLPSQFLKVEVSPRLTELKQFVKNHPETHLAHLSEHQEYSLLIK